MQLPGWTDFNRSDPGTPLLQLFAFLGEEVAHHKRRIAVGALVVAAVVWFVRGSRSDDD